MDTDLVHVTNRNKVSAKKKVLDIPSVGLYINNKFTCKQYLIRCIRRFFKKNWVLFYVQKIA